MLRKSESTVKRLRLSGEIPYIPGRPVLMDEADVHKYIERVKQLKLEATVITERQKSEANARYYIQMLQRKQRRRLFRKGS